MEKKIQESIFKKVAECRNRVLSESQKDQLIYKLSYVSMSVKFEGTIKGTKYIIEVRKESKGIFTIVRYNIDEVNDEHDLDTLNFHIVDKYGIGYTMIHTSKTYKENLDWVLKNHYKIKRKEKGGK